MISDKRPIQQLTRLLLAHDIEEAVLCPGSRNAPICHTLSQHLRCHAITDERSAGFFALGLALASGKAVCVVVTSGSALVNLHPAVCEAYYQQIPLVVVSADRPRSWIGQMDGQTMPQPGVFGSMVKRSVDLDEQDEWLNNRLINEALLETHHRTLGPVHINMPLSEPLYEFHAEQLPHERVIHRIEGLEAEHYIRLKEMIEACQRPMVILGQCSGLDAERNTLVGMLAERMPVVCEHLANTPIEGCWLLNDALMDRIEAWGYEERPDLIITMGGHLVNKRLKQWVRKHPPRQHWHISPDGAIADLFGCLTYAVETTLVLMLQLLISTHRDSTKPRLRQTGAEGAAVTDGEPCRLENVAVAALLQRLPESSVLHLANSSSVRLAQRWSLPPDVLVCCNRGINGIDGCLSTAVGVATAMPQRQHFVLIGDLAFHYDVNALWNDRLPQNLHILLLNNHGGRIFDTLPVPDDVASRRFITGASCPMELSALCAHFGLRHYVYKKRANDADGRLPQMMEVFVASQECYLLEIIDVD